MFSKYSLKNIQTDTYQYFFSVLYIASWIDQEAIGVRY